MKKLAFLIIFAATLLLPNKAFCETEDDFIELEEFLEEINQALADKNNPAATNSENVENEVTVELAEPAEITENSENNVTEPEVEVISEEEQTGQLEIQQNNVTEEPVEEDELEKMFNEDFSEDKASAKNESSPKEGNQTQDIDDFLNQDINQADDIVKEAVIEAEKAEKAQKDARQLLSQQPIILNLRDSQKRLILEGDEKRRQWQKVNKPEKKEIPVHIEETVAPELSAEELRQKELDNLTKNLSSAPFGLYWGASKEIIETLGFELKQIERENYTNVYQVLNPKQDKKTFEIISAIFGDQNRLWCIFAQSSAINDNRNASEVLALYHKYYNALKQKYGHAQEFFSPNIYTEDVIEGEGENQKKTQKVITSPMGGDNFLKELQEGTASLYATFENGEIGVTLAVFVNKNSQSSISLDYKNLKIMKQEQEENFNNLINDL